ncbi:hypothetical protein [Meiothermus taiwanensis]
MRLLRFLGRLLLVVIGLALVLAVGGWFWLRAPPSRSTRGGWP